MKGQFPWIGRSRGSAGGMTTSKVNDKNVMRAKAFEVSNPKTAAQVMQRDFFKQVQEVCASVTEDQLRSLFGVKPKTMTRRNALSKQIAAAYTITNGVKSVDFSKLLAIGNGEKVNTALVPVINGSVEEDQEWNEQNFPGAKNDITNVILVFFDTENNKIEIINTENTLFDEASAYSSLEPYLEGKTGYVYATCAVDGANVYNSPWGSFTMKTRASD